MCPLRTRQRRFPGRCIVKQQAAHCSFQVISPESLNPLANSSTNQRQPDICLISQSAERADMTSERRKENNDPIPKERLRLMTRTKMRDGSKFVLQRTTASEDDHLRWRRSSFFPVTCWCDFVKFTLNLLVSQEPNQVLFLISNT